MQLSQIAAKPQLIKMTIDDQDVVEQFGEPLEFYTWDRQPIESFMKLASVSNRDPEVMIDLVRTMILDDKGKEIIKDGLVLPSNILLKVIAKVTDLLGK